MSTESHDDTGPRFTFPTEAINRVFSTEFPRFTTNNLTVPVTPLSPGSLGPMKLSTFRREDSTDSFDYPLHSLRRNLNHSPSMLSVPGSPYTRRAMKLDSVSVNRLKLSTPEGSIYDASNGETPEDERKHLTQKNLTGIFSCIYGVMLTVVGSTIYINNQSLYTRHISEIFSVSIALAGILWLAFFHIDLFRYKQKVLSQVLGTSAQIDTISTCTGFNFALTQLDYQTPPYRFLTGRHSGSFYLKIGLAAFCFGHLIYEGLLLGQQVLDFVQEERYLQQCGEPLTLIAHVIKPLHSFYQLFIIFKYSNIVINRYKGVACFAVMHLMATCLCFWFATIVEDALENYHHKLSERKQYKQLNNNTGAFSEYLVCAFNENDTSCKCALNSILSINNVHAIPYLYPFTIEFNLMLAGVWFIVWQNIGREDNSTNPHHFHHKIQSNGDGEEEVTYQSNLVISADCHASNKGLFAGLFLLLASIISIIVFFVAMSDKKYHTIGLTIHSFQEVILMTLSLICVLVAYRQLGSLDYNKHPVTFLDDVLLFLPLPFYFVQAVLTVIYEYKNRSIGRSLMSVLVPLQVVLQTPLIIDGLRRCSNSQDKRYKKPGREIITFLIVCNLTMWIINTFEAKSVESHYGLDAYFGEFLWMAISHTTLPLMLFYRFHSSVCLADIWKSAYEKGE